ncbi:Ras-related protein Rab-26 [Papilio xuthus]|uniref:Ras-related protein Rab-26 n=1 Tax=Papilio xuthus TaxID=66420 RepID=A0A194Q9Q6_PAPXU|nr:Ras-related protein Rab-26 [Papilio xuthus]
MWVTYCIDVGGGRCRGIVGAVREEQVTTDDSMSDDVFEEDTLRAPAPRSTPSPTGYPDYRPPTDIPRSLLDEDLPIHKTILLGDSGVGKTSLLVQFETGKFQPGNFSATVGIGFTLSTFGPRLPKIGRNFLRYDVYGFGFRSDKETFRFCQ